MINCYDCKYAIWEARIFAEVRISEMFEVFYHSEQFDCHCILNNKFFLEYDEPECSSGEYGKNNLMNVCREHNKLLDRYKKLLTSFRTLRNKTEEDFIDIASNEEFQKWIDYLKEHDLELYKIVTESKRH
mgnify:CR=1 FL=1